MKTTYKCKLHCLGETKDASAKLLKSGDYEIMSKDKIVAIVVNAGTFKRKLANDDMYFYAC